MGRLTEIALQRIDAFCRRCWLAWRYIRAMHDCPRVAWAKARRA